MPIQKVKNGTYTVDISLGIDPITGKRRRTTRRGIKTKKEAEQIYLSLKNKYYKNEISSNRILDFNTLSQIYFNSQENKHKKIYQVNQKYTFNKHILPYFINTQIKKVTYTDILEFQKKLIQTKLSNKSINKILIIVRQIFNTAINEGIILKNPCDKVPKLRVEKHEMKFWTPQEFKKFINSIHDNEEAHKVFFTTAYLTGARCGELLALQWKDVDLRKKIIHINKTLHNIKQENFIDTPKTKSSHRNIALNSQLFNILISWKEEQKILFKQLKLEHTDNSFVFQFREITPTRNQFTKRIATVCKRAELEPIRLHDFRHSHVALLIELGEDITVIKERLGHSSITTTIDTYGHLFPNRQKKLADKLDDLF